MPSPCDTVEALEAEEAVGDAFIGPEQEAAQWSVVLGVRVWAGFGVWGLGFGEGLGRVWRV